MIVKICGLRTLAGAQVAVEAGADLLGFNFVPGIRRRIRPDDAHAIIRALPRHAQTVGIFVNPSLDSVQVTVEHCGLDWVQLSGTESPQFCRAVQQRTIKAVRLGTPQRESDWPPEDYDDVDVLLADAAVPGAWGGTGTTTDWEAAQALASQRRILLAGGLNAANVATAIAAVQPWGVDVASGIETDGQSDPAKIAAFIAAARAVAG